MAGLLAATRRASEIVERTRRRDASRGRNDPCPCGGARKWKRCHGADPSPPVGRTGLSMGMTEVAIFAAR